MPTLNGTDRSETLSGGAGSDTINGRAGTDVLNGGGGADTIQGGNGADTLNGGDGDDILYGFGATDVNARSGEIVASRIATGFANSLFATSAPGDPDRLFVVEQHTGRIFILDTETGQTVSQPFLDIANSELANGSERGLLGLAFHPDYATNGKFYVNLTNAAGDTEIWEYTRSTANSEVADPASRRLLLTFDQPDTNHNGGWLGFGPDGYLYIASGDGGGAGDPDNNAQNLDSLLGKILRIDVNGDDFPADTTRNYAIPDDNPFVGIAGADEVWAYGVRNPWRPSFDRTTGDFYIADVGQNAREEVNFVAAGTGAGSNFGWRIREGDIGYSGETATGLVDPVLVYPHGTGPDAGQSITGGYVYRGPGGGQGLYFFGDFVRGNIWTTQIADGQAVDFLNRNEQIRTTAGVVDQIASFAEDGRGRLYVIGLDGEIFLLTPSAAAGDGADVISGGDGADRIYGGAGADRLAGDDGDDQLSGGLGNDRLDGGRGGDTLAGGLGNDSYFIDSTGDRIVEAAGEGKDTIYSAISFRLTGTEIENATLTGSLDRNLTGNAMDNVLVGNGGANTLSGGDGRDDLTGGGGVDRFDFNAVSETSFANYDRIRDLGDDDIIDLSGIDANTTASGNQAFAMVDAFTGAAGQLTLTYSASSGFTVLAADVTGDGVADMRIVIYGDHEDFTHFVF